jgi:ABC-2 type transport system permease protein
MSTMRRRTLLPTLAARVRASLSVAMQYRSDFFTDAIVESLWVSGAVVPLLVVFETRPNIAGWSMGEALLVTAVFELLQMLIQGVLNPSFGLTVEQIRKGTFDFTLLVPQDSLLLASCSRLLPFQLVHVIGAGILFFVAWHKLPHAPSAPQVALALMFLCASAAMLHSIWTLITSVAFYVVRVDNLTYLFESVFDLARWPRGVFRGALRTIFSTVVPLTLMTSVPAEALLGRLDLRSAASALGIAEGLSPLARWQWNRAVRNYTSASS